MLPNSEQNSAAACCSSDVAVPPFTARLRLHLGICIATEWNQLWQSDASCASAQMSEFATSTTVLQNACYNKLLPPQARRDLNNIEDGFYISPAFLDKISIHVAKNFLDLPKIKVPLILGEAPAQPCFEMQSQLMRALLGICVHNFSGHDRVCALHEESLGAAVQSTTMPCRLAWAHSDYVRWAMWGQGRQVPLRPCMHEA